jgi:integrase
MSRGNTASLKIGHIGNYWLSQRPNSPAWCKTWYDPATSHTVRESLGTSDLREAQDRLALFCFRNPTQDRKHPSQVKVLDVLVWHWEGRSSKLASSVAFRNSFAHWSSYFTASTVVEDLTPLTISNFRDHLAAAGLSDGTIIRIIGDGRTALNWARNNMLVLMVPQIKTGQSRQHIEDTPPKGKPLSVEELARIFRANPAPHVEAFMIIMLNTLCRPGAARDLTQGQIDSEHGLVTLNPPGRKQTQKRRPIVPLTASLRNSLVMIEQRKDFVSHYVSFRGSPVRGVYDAWQRLVVDAGFDRSEETITPYSIRHTMARELRKSRVPSEQISVYLGHRPADISAMTSVYAPYEPDYLKEASEVVEAYVCRLRAEVMKGDFRGSIL